MTAKRKAPRDFGARGILVRSDLPRWDPEIYSGWIYDSARLWARQIVGPTDYRAQNVLMTEALAALKNQDTPEAEAARAVRRAANIARSTGLAADVASRRHHPPSTD